MSQGIQRLLQARPQWQRVVSAGEALGLRSHELLHAGPPLDDPCRPPAVLLSSAVMSCLHEGWADSEATAEALIAQGRVTLMPAQARGCVTPLAATVSMGTPLIEVGDAADDSARAWAPVSTVRGPDTRMGHRDAGIVERLKQRDELIAPALARALEADGPVDLWPLAVQGLAGGDDLHSRTSAATQALADLLDMRGAQPVAEQVAATPLFFLTLWMAACALLLRAVEGGDAPTLVARAGGNGERFGIALAGSPDTWATIEASAPAGRLMPQIAAGTLACGAIGDSAVIDMLGFGGQGLALAPEPLQVLGDFLPADHATLAKRLLVAAHPQLGDARPLGLDARRVVDADAAPLVALAMIGADGRSGFIGRGVWRPPVELFRRAIDRFNARTTA